MAKIKQSHKKSPKGRNPVVRALAKNPKPSGKHQPTKRKEKRQMADKY